VNASRRSPRESAHTAGPAAPGRTGGDLGSRALRPGVWCGAASLLPGSRVPLCRSNSRSPSSTRDITVDSRRALLSRLVRLSGGCALLPGCLSSRENGGLRSADSSAAVALLAVTTHPPEGTQAHSSAGSQASFADRQNPGSLGICSPAERLRFAPCRRYQLPSLRLHSCGTREAGNPKLSRLIA